MTEETAPDGHRPPIKLHHYHLYQFGSRRVKKNFDRWDFRGEFDSLNCFEHVF